MRVNVKITRTGNDPRPSKLGVNEMGKSHFSSRTVVSLLLVIYLLAGVSGPIYAAHVSAPVFANVEGFVVAPMIGTLSITDGLEFPNMADIQADFLFDPAFAVYDDFYDFRWINVQTSYVVDGVGKLVDPVTGTLPGIDPQPGGGEDQEPFYYTDAEWNSGMAGATTIRTENVSSVFWDSPQDDQGNVIGFMLSLVVEDISAGNFPDDTVYVLDSLVWAWGWGADADAAISVFVSFLGGGNFMTINTALGNASSAVFDNWQADSLLTLIVPVPIPAAVWLLGSALGFLGWMRRKAA